MSIQNHLDKSHNSLEEIQGGTISERYHLTSNQYNITSSLSVNGGELLFNGSTIGSGSGTSDHTLLTNLNTSTYSHVTSTIANIVASLSVNNNELMFNGSTLASTEDLIATKYPPFSVTVSEGILISGTIADILTPNGGTTIRVDETNPGGLTVELEFHDVVEFNSISLRIQYAGGSSHIIQQQIWNKTALTWDFLSEQIGPQTALTWMTNAISNSDNYINAGVVKIRLYHVAPFNSSHYLLIDYVSLVASVGGSIIPIPSQTQAEAINNTSGTPFLWPVIRLKQFVTAWWASISDQYAPALGPDDNYVTDAEKVAIATIGSGDIDWENPLSINAATTLSIGRTHIITAATAFTVTLPPIEGNLGKFLHVEIHPDSVANVTVDGDGTELIDAELIRVMHHEESAVLRATATGWTKVSGRTVPMKALLYPTAAISVAHDVTTIIPAAAAYYDHGGFYNGGVSLKIPRKSQYTLIGVPYFQTSSGDSKFHAVVFSLNTDNNYLPTTQCGYLQAVSVGMAVSVPLTLDFAQGDTIKTWAQQSQASGSAARSLYVNNFAWTRIMILEVPTW